MAFGWYKNAEYTESGLRFSFNPGWVVKKYDAHRFFQGLAGAGLKGVDFIATDGRQVLLCEAKNYRRRQPWQKENPLDAILASPGDFAVEMAQKVQDTLRGIKVIGLYYHRKWLYRALQPLFLRLAPGGRDWRFWAHIYRLVQAPENIVFILWLETEQPQRQLTDGVETALRHHLRRRLGQLYVASDNKHPLHEVVHASLA
ncbi:MAG: hypothetical protein H6564_17000 [Lewinellaceae bacterium]|nr:hypothetical protein [Lewinellaceae bacterium]